MLEEIDMKDMKPVSDEKKFKAKKKELPPLSPKSKAFFDELHKKPVVRRPDFEKRVLAEHMAGYGPKPW